MLKTFPAKRVTATKLSSARRQGRQSTLSPKAAGRVITASGRYFTATMGANGGFVARAGTFLNGPDLDKGPSDLSVNHIFQINGLVELPWQIQVSSILRSQSGFHFSRTAAVTEDPDVNGTFNTIDHGPGAGRNAFTAPPFVNLDMHLAKRFAVGERVKVQVLFKDIEGILGGNFSRVLSGI